MRMTINTDRNDPQPNEHMVSEELYKEIMVLILARTHPELGGARSRPRINFKTGEGLLGRNPECICPADGHSELCPVCKTKSSPR